MATTSHRVPAGMLTGSQVQRQAGVTKRELDWWCRTGIIDPAGSSRGDPNRPGSGNWRLFTIRDVVCVRTVRLLLAAGHNLSGSVVARALEAVRRSPSLEAMVVIVPLSAELPAMVVPIHGASVVMAGLAAAGMTDMTLIDGDRLVT